MALSTQIQKKEQQMLFKSTKISLQHIFFKNFFSFFIVIIHQKKKEKKKSPPFIAERGRQTLFFCFFLHLKLNEAAAENMSNLSICSQWLGF